MKFNSLTPEEERIIVNKGTEMPHSGEYEHFNREGMYTCRRCGAYLYRSENKFDSHCGWPSFDAEVLGAVKRSVDTDGMRTEITCARCDAHLGHVFVGERFTEKNTRHCVNSLSMKFVSKEEIKEAAATAYFGSGCFWCTEAAFKMIQGVLAVTSGYAGGTKEKPSYEEVSTGKTGHAEVVRVEYDPTRIAYEALLEVFFFSHDPTTVNRQGHDEGTQYRSVILYTDDLQRELAEAMISKLNAEHLFEKPIVTEVQPFKVFYEAEGYHQDYYAKNPEAAYCQAVIAPKVAKLRAGLTKYMKG